MVSGMFGATQLGMDVTPSALAFMFHRSFATQASTLDIWKGVTQ